MVGEIEEPQAVPSPSDVEAAERVIAEDRRRRNEAAAAAAQADRDRTIAYYGPTAIWSAGIARAPRNVETFPRVQQAEERFVKAVESAGFNQIREAYLLLCRMRHEANVEAYRRYWAITYLMGPPRYLRPDGTVMEPAMARPPTMRLPFYGQDQWQGFGEALEAAFERIVPHDLDTIKEEVEAQRVEAVAAMDAEDA